MRLWVTLVRACAVAAVVARLAAPALAQAPSAEPQSTLDKVKGRGKLLVGCIPDLPYAGEDSRTGKWRGYFTHMAADMARELKVEWECVSITWGTAVLALQSGKVDVVMELGGLPQRALVVDFVGPASRQAFMMITRKGLAGTTWDDFNKPEIRVAVQTGTTNELILGRVAPKATKVGLSPGVDPSLAVSSGRADAFLSTFLTGTVAHAKNPGIGDLVLPTPIVHSDDFLALRFEPDPRWKSFVHNWAVWNSANGSMREWVKRGLIESGVPEDTLPDLRTAGF